MLLVAEDGKNKYQSSRCYYFTTGQQRPTGERIPKCNNDLPANGKSRWTSSVWWNRCACLHPNMLLFAGLLSGWIDIASPQFQKSFQIRCYFHPGKMGLNGIVIVRFLLLNELQVFSRNLEVCIHGQTFQYSGRLCCRGTDKWHVRNTEVAETSVLNAR